MLPARRRGVMARHRLRRRTWLAVLVGAAICFLGESRVSAAEKETRTFAIKIDNQAAGTYQMTLSRPDERTVVVDCRAEVSISKLLIYNYKYSYQGTEFWRDGRLVRLSSKSNDDGNLCEVLAQTNGDALRVRVNGKDHTI